MPIDTVIVDSDSSAVTEHAIYLSYRMLTPIKEDVLSSEIFLVQEQDKSEQVEEV